MILEMFREDISRHTILIFSHADRLRRESIERFVSRQNQKVQDLVERFGRRFVAFDNTNPTNRDQVRRLLQKVDELLVLNENRHFTNKVTVTMQKAQKIVEEIQNEQRLVLLGRTDLVKRFGRRFVAFDNTNPANRDQVRRLLQKVDELLVLNENRHFTNEVTEAMQKAQKIVEERIQAETAERARKIKEEVRKMADVRWRAFLSDMNEERQETERRRKRIQRRIDQIQEDIKKEEQNVEPIPERLKRYSMSLQTELENMGRLEERRMEDERERKEQEERERNDLDIWIQEEEQRRLDEEKPKNLFSPEHIKIVTMLSMFILGIGATFAPALLAFLFPAAPVAPAGFAAGILTRLLAAEGWGFVWVAAGVAKAAVLTRCSIQ
ncbi:hypothetical protein Q8A67_008473 [Cirrhinus molitorella]|uniref:AIG1-type G domain-containing protein n=1 Tax=Cirrhinus molitorella TaxID=172907 RepID=A0AA88PXF4_9TELE|nr:hypothetical protein Q8A67_008473 [Cirrhinus molitorella]